MSEKTFTIKFASDSYTVTTDRYGAYYTHIDSGCGTLSIDDNPVQELDLAPGQHLNYDFSIPQ